MLVQGSNASLNNNTSLNRTPQITKGVILPLTKILEKLC